MLDHMEITVADFEDSTATFHHPNHYGAFVIELNDHNIEAVCHPPE